MDCPDRWPRLVVEAACEHAACSEQGFQTLEAVVRLAVELVHEGREGHSVGTMMTVGDADSVLERSHALHLDPLAGHDAAVRRVSRWRLSRRRATGPAPPKARNITVTKTLERGERNDV